MDFCQAKAHRSKARHNRYVSDPALDVRGNPIAGFVISQVPKPDNSAGAPQKYDKQMPSVVDETKSRPTMKAYNERKGIEMGAMSKYQKWSVAIAFTAVAVLAFVRLIS
ncbi:hypothetical protein [Xanthomonas phaseoli]|uniref:hypothetical protein n=1 Tax=Xanthomonas phaseoli TaxID=1985254 RepID=UPI001266FCF7|nr:hypothetical protein [Xanthomonas phaseoli]